MNVDRLRDLRQQIMASAGGPGALFRENIDALLEIVQQQQARVLRLMVAIEHPLSDRMRSQLEATADLRMELLGANRE